MHRMLIILAGLAALLLSGCGFQPLYAVAEPGNAPGGIGAVNLVSVTSTGEAQPIIEQALERRLGGPVRTSARYDLTVSARARAKSLAVRIDSSVTRYNYTLRARYLLTRRSDGRTFSGRAESVASFNIVTSQYSTLFAEHAAREKAARMLAEEIERDILLRLAADRRRGEESDRDIEILDEEEEFESLEFEPIDIGDDAP